MKKRGEGYIEREKGWVSGWERIWRKRRGERVGRMNRISEMEGREGRRGLNEKVKEEGNGKWEKGYREKYYIYANRLFKYSIILSILYISTIYMY